MSGAAPEQKKKKRRLRRTSVIAPIRSISRAGLRGSSFGVECPLGGEDDAREEAVAEAVMEAP